MSKDTVLDRQKLSKTVITKNITVMKPFPYTTTTVLLHLYYTNTETSTNAVHPKAFQLPKL